MNRSLLCLILVLLANGYVFSKCYQATDCVECVAVANKDCRWCPLDRKCHAKGAGVVPGIGDNPCAKRQNVLESSHCPTPSTAVYDKQLAYELLLLSSAAYYYDPDKCMDKLGSDFPTSGIDHYQFYDIASMPCDDFYFDYPGNECFAFLALSHHRKLITLSYRGTTKAIQLLDQVITVLELSMTRMGNGHVQQYFYNAYLKLQECLEGQIRQLLTDYPDYRVAITGHSLGGGIASIAAYQLVTQGIVPANNTLLYTYGMPRVGDKDYALEFDTIFDDSWRVVNYRDCVTHLPSCGVSCITSPSNSPFHHKTEVYYRTLQMTEDYQPLICLGNEDDHCSHDVQGPVMTPKHLLTGDCKHDHKVYFGIGVGKHCEIELKNERSKRSTSYKDLLCQNTCSILIRTNGTWAHKNGAPVPCVKESTETVITPNINDRPRNSGSFNFITIVTLILAVICSKL